MGCVVTSPCNYSRKQVHRTLCWIHLSPSFICLDLGVKSDRLLELAISLHRMAISGVVDCRCKHGNDSTDDCSNVVSAGIAVMATSIGSSHFEVHS
jgi:hypothetical protein